MEQPSGNASAFGQADPTDGRQRYDWKSKYNDAAARTEIAWEAVYLGILLFALPVVMVIFWLGYPACFLHLSYDRYRPLLKYVFAWTSGSLGGVLFDLK